MTYTGGKATYTAIMPPIGQGGEGAVYNISGRPNHVMKIFKPEKRTESRRKKLEAMLKTPLTENAMEQITWPYDIVTENGKFVGYVMPRIKNNESLHAAYSDKYVCTLSEKITIAMNLCAAVNAVHNAGQVCGDLNPNNIQVDPADATITLVDADSYHIREGKTRVYRCEVGLPEYLAAEVQAKMKNGQTLATAPLPTFTVYTDLFAVAVHVFALLMNGCHPFACAVDGNYNINRLTSSQPSIAAPQPIDNIKNGNYPFYYKKAGITAPKYAPDINYLPSYIRDLFERAFVTGHMIPTLRPTCVDWHKALEAMQKSLRTCSVDKTHKYPTNNTSCPWCALENKFTQHISKTKSVTTPTVKTGDKGKRTTSASNLRLNTTSSNTKAKTTNTTTRSTYTTSRSYPSTGHILFYWITTIVLAIIMQLIFHNIFGEQIVEWAFGEGDKEGWKNFLINFAANVGIWGFIVTGTITTIIWNFYAHDDGSYFGFEFYQGVLALVAAVVGNVAWLALVYIVTIGIQLILAVIVIYIVCSIFSGG